MEVYHGTKSADAAHLAGYRFSLADHACGELLNQRLRGSIGDDGFRAIVTCLETFLDPTFPVMLGEIDVMVMIGAEPVDRTRESPASVSSRAWDLFRTQQVDIIGLDELLEDERDQWKSMFGRWNKISHPQPFSELYDPEIQNAFRFIDTRGIVHPPLSTRFDLMVRYAWRQFVRSRKYKDAYDVSSQKKRNDGIDFNLYTYLALPAFLIATERGFLSAIQDIPSFQKEWIFTPSALIEAWSKGGRPRPVWPPKVRASYVRHADFDKGR